MGGAYNEEISIRKFYTRFNARKEENKFDLLDGRTCTAKSKRNHNEASIIECRQIQKSEESHNRPNPQETQQRERKRSKTYEN